MRTISSNLQNMNESRDHPKREDTAGYSIAWIATNEMCVLTCLLLLWANMKCGNSMIQSKGGNTAFFFASFASHIGLFITGLQVSLRIIDFG